MVLTQFCVLNFFGDVVVVGFISFHVATDTPHALVLPDTIVAETETETNDNLGDLKKREKMKKKRRNCLTFK